MDKILERKTCKQCLNHFDVTQNDRDFYEKISPIFWWKKYQIPDPTLCPECRQQRRLAWRNERKLYKRKCDATGKDVISLYSPDKSCVVFKNDVWWWDSWDPIVLNKDKKDFFEGRFFEKYQYLLQTIPRFNILNNNTENSEYASNAAMDKNCYYTFLTLYAEDCMYSYLLSYTKNCLDILYGIESENCYECVNVWKCYNCFYCIDSKLCKDSEYLYHCDNVSSSIFCTALKNKKNSFLNQQYTVEQIKDIKSRLNNDTSFYLDSKNTFEKIKKDTIHKNLEVEESQEVFWNHITFSKNLNNAFDVHHSKNLNNAFDCSGVDNSRDIYLAWWDNKLGGLSYCYEWDNIVNTFHCLFCSSVWYSQDMLYCDTCFYSKNCFWCVWLKNKQYCILNKQYTKEEYEELVPKIIEQMKEKWEWWEFFPASMSLFWYNETIAQEYFPLTKSEALERNFNWSDYEVPPPKVDKIISASKLPENIQDIPDDILNWAIECEITKKPFRIIRQELEFYRKHHLPVPKRHPDQRHLDRMKLRNSRKLFTRNCGKCSVEMQTTYAPERPETVYCESCYNSKIY